MTRKPGHDLAAGSTLGAAPAGRAPRATASATSIPTSATITVRPCRGSFRESACIGRENYQPPPSLPLLGPMPEPITRGERYMPGLDGLRAIAVLAVIFFHLGFGCAPGGLLGVGVFLALSGFLVSDILLGQFMK